MSVESTQKVISQFLDSKHTDVSMMADDVVFTLMADGTESRTPEGVLQMLNYFYRTAFDADAEESNRVVSDDKAVVEGVFFGKHIGDFGGIPPTGRDVRVPLCVVYELENDKIRRARIYVEIPILMQQLGVAPGMAETPASSD